MSQFSVASVTQLRTIQRLVHMGRYAYCGVADEDMETIIARGGTILAAEREAIWGVLMVDPEVRPATLPLYAPARAQIRALAMRHGPWMDKGVTDLVQGLQRLLPDNLRPLMLSTYATDAWLQNGVARAGFAHADTVVYYRLNLPRPGSHAAAVRSDGAKPAAKGPAQLHAATLNDSQQLAEMDADIFDPLWHFGASEIVEMLVRGRIQIATIGGEMAGYAALLTGQRREAHLARLGVHPRFQRRGLGRQLLGEAVDYAQAEGFSTVALNTQASNLRSQALYTNFGFVPSGIEMPVMTLSVD
jgi:ribosomal protein S18 acetylase RimI-like enzyme